MKFGSLGLGTNCHAAEEPGSEKAQNRVEVVRLLCEARANKNAVDMSLGRERTRWITD